MHIKIKKANNIPLKEIVNEAPSTSRLKSRQPFHKSKLENFSLKEAWKTDWIQNTPRGGDIIPDPTKLMPGFSNSGRKLWVTLNRLLTRHGKTAANMHRWNLRDTNRCRNCEGGPQTTYHIILHCPVTVLDG